MSARRALTGFRAPDEPGAEDRAWEVVRFAHRERASAARQPSPRRFAVVFAAAVTIGVVVLSPAGATVGRLITRALGIPKATAALSSLPTSGRLLVSGPAGTWTVAADGSLRRLGPWPQASWSPRGRFVAVALGNRLAAIDPRGSLQWALTRPQVSDPQWYSPSGFRVAYLSGAGLRVVAGDGSGDHLLALGVAKVAPAWRPGHKFQLAYLTSEGKVVVRDGDTGRALWSGGAPPGSTRLQWSADGRYLLALSPTTARLYSASGARLSAFALPEKGRPVDVALSPDGRLLAVVLGGASDEVVVEDLLSPRSPQRVVLAEPGLDQVLWSPDSRWLLITWPAANEWVFARVGGTPRIAAVSHIDQQFGRGAHFPQVEGWCCTVR